ncbi:MAG: porin family protein [Flavobacteriales bacterium]
MKLKCLFIGAFLFTSMLFSQEVDFGVKAGVNFSTLTKTNGASNRTGFVAGIFGAIKLSNKLGIQADLLYSQQGAKFDVGDFNLNYVNVPVVAKYYLIKGLNVQLGPQFGFKVDDNISKVFGNVVKAESFDLSGLAGVGFDLPMGIRLAGRYHFGLTDTFNIDNTKNAVFTLSVGYSFF